MGNANFLLRVTGTQQLMEKQPICSVCWHGSIISALGMNRQEASSVILSYTVSLRPIWATWETKNVWSQGFTSQHNQNGKEEGTERGREKLWYRWVGKDEARKLNKESMIYQNTEWKTKHRCSRSCALGKFILLGKCPSEENTGERQKEFSEKQPVSYTFILQSQGTQRGAQAV